jgi:vitellogenic carboxypeptidase-like protein
MHARTTPNTPPPGPAHSHPHTRTKLGVLWAGQDDPQDGPAINEPWIRHIDWGGNKGFTQTKRELWRLGGRDPKEGLLGGGRAKPDPKGDVVGYWREYDTLTHVVIRNAGHMVPHDQPEVSQVGATGYSFHACMH